MNPLTWKVKTLTSVGLCIFAMYYLFIFKWSHHFSYTDIVKNTKAEQVWNFIADFSNMKKLNPTLEDFKVIHESGNYRHWIYTIEYTEHLSYVPMIRHVTQATFSVIPKIEEYVIESSHRTCFMGTSTCLDSVSEFRFLPHGNHTKCMEEIVYQCPLVFAYLCYKEVLYQRQAIMNNVRSHFNAVNKKELKISGAQIFNM